MGNRFKAARASMSSENFHRAQRRNIIVASIVALGSILAAHAGAKDTADPPAAPPVPLRSLQDAAAAGDLDRVKELLELGANIDAYNPNRHETALLTSLKANQPEVAAFLLDRGADVTIAGAGDDSPLLHAAHWGLTDLVDRMLDLGADPAKADSRQQTPLRVAAARGHVETVRRLAEGAVYVNAADSNGKSAFDYSLGNPYEEIAVLLLDAGARFVVQPESTMHRVDKLVEKRWFAALDKGLQQIRGPKRLQQLLDRAYDIAFGLGDSESLKWLLDRGANVNSPTVSGDPRLLVAAENSAAAIVQTMLEAGADPNQPAPRSRWTPLHAAALNADAGVVRMLLDREANPNAADALGRTPLHLAASAGNADAIAELLAAGADPARLDSAGNSALHFAAGSRSKATVQKLLDAKAPQTANAGGRLPYDLASGPRAAEIQALLQAPVLVPPAFEEIVPFLAADNSPGAIAAAREQWSSLAANGTPLIHIAVHAGSLRAVQRLLNQDRTRLAARDAAGIQPIHLAAERADTSILLELLARGAALNDQANLARWTPLHCAAAAGNLNGINMLLSKGAGAKALDANGKSAKQIAQDLGHTAIAAAIPG